MGLFGSQLGVDFAKDSRIGKQIKGARARGNEKFELGIIPHAFKWE